MISQSRMSRLPLSDLCSASRAAGDVRSLVLSIAAMAVCGSCGQNPVRPDLKYPILPVQIDFSQAWSHDGRLIAFRRAYDSSYGPPGIYLMSSLGGQPRWLTSASLDSPSNLQFSPDDKMLVGVDNFQLIIVDVQSGQRSSPLSTNSAVEYPSWSPDGRTIAYYRVSYDPNNPPDSSFVHLFNITSGTDHSLKINGGYIIGFQLHYAPDGRLAMVQNLPPAAHDRLVIVDAQALNLTPAYDTGTLKDYNNLQWLWRPSTGTISLVFRMQLAPGGSWMVNPDGSALRPFGHLLGPYDVISPNGTQFVTYGVDPKTHVGILDVQNIDDHSGATRRHLTSYEPVGNPVAASMLTTQSSSRHK